MITIIGMIRSGTSLAAKLACEAGVDMGMSMIMPQHGSHPEYEDAFLVARLLEGPAVSVDEFKSYIELREMQFHQKQVWNTPPVAWGFKSPLLVPQWRNWKRALEEKNLSQYVIKLNRNPVNVHASIENAALSIEHKQAIYRRQEAIMKHLDRIEADIEIENKELQENPELMGAIIHGALR